MRKSQECLMTLRSLSSCLCGPDSEKHLEDLGKDQWTDKDAIEIPAYFLPSSNICDIFDTLFEWFFFFFFFFCMAGPRGN